jgi:DNA-binding NtrC family response regulator
MNTVQSLVLLNENGSVRPGDLPKEIFEEGMAPPLCGKFKVLKEELIRDFETKYFKVLLTDTRGNITKAATLSGLNRKTLTEKLTELGFDASLFKDSIRS